MRRARKRHGRSRLPQGQRTYTIKVSNDRKAGEYSGAATLADTVRMAREEFVPYVGRNATVKVVHFDRYGERTIVDKYVQSPPIGGYVE